MMPLSDHFSPYESDSEYVGEGAAEVIETDGDLAYATSEWTRVLAANEIREDGAYTQETIDLPPVAWGFAREVFASLYGMDPKLPEDERTGWANEVHRATEALPEWKALRRTARGDPWACGVSSSVALKAVHDSLTKALEGLEVANEGEVQKVVEAAQATGESLPDTWVDEQLNKLAAAEKHLSGDLAQAILEGNLAEAAREAMDEIGEMRQALSGFGAGKGGAAQSALNSPQEPLRRALSENPELRRIAALAGRFEAAASSSRRSDDGRNREEVTGVTFGNNISLMLPQYRTMPKALLMKKYKDAQLPQWHITGSEKEKGPIVIVIDESSSMQNESPSGIKRIHMAKALMLTLMQTCIAEDRPFAFVRYSSWDKDPVIFIAKDPSAVKFDELKPHICSMMAGGTSTSKGLEVGQRTADYLGPEADIVLVTDGDDDWNALVMNHEARLHGIAIGRPFDDDQLGKLASAVELQDVDIDNAESKIGVVLGL